MSEYNSDVMDEGAIITDVTDEERACLLGGGAGRSSDRSSYRVIEIAKGRPENPEILDRFANPEDRPSLVDANAIRNGTAR